MNNCSSRPLASLMIGAAMACPVPGWADDADALSLQSGPVSAAAPKDLPSRFFIEAAVGQSRQRYGLPSETLKRLSIDFTQTFRLGGGWRATVSDRLDETRPVLAGERSTVNSLREAYAGWSDELGSALFEIGRINMRLGPAYGYNPTDFFRSGSIRSATSDDPFALRENRLGTVMLHYQKLWGDGSMAIAVAPKLATVSNTASFNPDFGATNHSHRALLTWSHKGSGGLSGQMLFFAEQHKGVQLGLNMTALLSNAVVGHAEWTGGRDALALDRASSGSKRVVSRNRIAAGATYTAPSSLAVTLEFAYNGFAPSASEWESLAAANPALLAGYLSDAQRQQDLAARQAWLLYVAQRNVGMKNLDITAFVRFNADDNSRLAWLEARYHWAQFDAALQWRVSQGRANSEFGLQPRREALQLLGAWYF